MRPGFLAFSVAMLFLGAAIYIGLVEQPARLKLGLRSMVREWDWSNRRGSLLLIGLAVISAILAFVQFKTNGDVRWLIGAATILAVWPYIYFVMMPVNIWLAAMAAAGKPISPARTLMRDWGLLEWGQALIGFAACCAYAWALELPAC